MADAVINEDIIIIKMAEHRGWQAARRAIRSRCRCSAMLPMLTASRALKSAVHYDEWR